jgi:UDP-sulfoquinovose synthase
MRILILGGDGYLGWPASMYFSNLGHEVACVDNFIKRFWEARLGVSPLNPIDPLVNRVDSFKEASGKDVQVYIGDLAESERFVYRVFQEFIPDVVIHLAEQPSAPFSMRSRSDCVETHRNNIIGNLNVMFAIQKYCPDCHLIKLGTMGEYGTPNIAIEEGWLEVDHKGRKDRVLYPKKPGSFYHCSKVADSVNLEFACRAWGMRVTDLNQGVVYGSPEIDFASEPGLHTSFHYDETFGTVLNRFMIQAIVERPLTVYGNGSQTRGFLHINDTLQCLRIAAENPASVGDFRVFNQFTETFSVASLARMVVDSAVELGLKTSIANIENPRVEQYDHYYEAVNTSLFELGLEPLLLDTGRVQKMISELMVEKTRINEKYFAPKTKWSFQ